MKKEMTSQERVSAAISHKEPDRVPIQDSPWGATVTKWHEQGLPHDVSPADYFGYEFVSLFADLSPRFPCRVIEETDEFITATTSTGSIRRNHKDYSSTPEVIECPIKKKDDWLPIRERLYPDRTRVDWDGARRTFQDARAKGKYITFAAASGYDLMQGYIRSEDLLLFMAEDPDWIKEMMDLNSDLILETLEMFLEEGIKPDGVWVFNDMGYRNNSLFSPAMFDVMIAPSDTKRNDWLHEQGIQTLLHSCGCVKGLIPNFIKCGFDCLQPLEVKAGMDLRVLKPAFGDQIAFFGGIDVMKMEVPDDSEIENEIREKFAVAKKGGGYIFHSDHSIPVDVSFEKYKFVIECVMKYGRYD